MKNTILTIGFLIGLILIPNQTYTQEDKIEVEDSAEVFLEEYSDDFQEKFFEALKQKGIENYDRSINLLLECKLLDANNKVVDHELAKVYLADKKYLLAQEYSIEALVSEPTNSWYLNTLVEILQKQGNSIDNVKSSIPYDDAKLKENLALIYFKQKNYVGAKVVLKDLKKSAFTEDLASKINDSIENSKQKQAKKKVVSFSSTNMNNSRLDPSQGYITQIKGLIMTNNFIELEKVSDEALENYPSQPYFYYAQGLALNKKGRNKDAIEILEAGLDYMIGNNISLANDIYAALADAYTATNNTVKSNMYLRKIKPGF